MSTRCNIIVKDSYGEELIFYRHSDGYPDGALPLLEAFTEYVEAGAVRDNVSQACGWLILMGATEYGAVAPQWNKKTGERPRNWKCGSIEPTTGIHGDIEYLYVVDLKSRTIAINPPYLGKFGEWEGRR